jgi:TPR repeat protein
VTKDDAKAFSYFEQIADQQAEISPTSPVAKYAAEAFVALGQYYLDGIPAMPLGANPSYAADLFRHAASYFGNAEAQYRLARLYMSGTGVEKNVGLAVNWLAIAAKKQHAASQATLGEILWRGQDVPEKRARGLALIILAHENALVDGKEPQWIGALYKEAFSTSDTPTRKGARALLSELGGVKASPAEILAMPAAGEVEEPVAAPADTALGASARAPAPIGLSVGFGGNAAQGEIKR